MGIFDRIQAEIEAQEKQEGITPADLLDLSPPLRSLMTQIIRAGEMTVDDAAKQLGESATNTRKTLDGLVEKGYLQRKETAEGWLYKTRFARKRGRDIPPGIWSALEQRTKDKK